MMLDFLIERFDHTLLIHMTVKNSYKPLLVNQIQLVQPSLNPFVFVQVCILYNSQGMYLNFDQ